MKQKSLSIWLKIIIVGVTVCIAVIYAWIMPALAMDVAVMNPEYRMFFWPWLIFILVTAAPILAAIVLAWNIADNIGKDRSFCMANAKMLKAISILAAADTAYFFIGNIVFVALKAHHPGPILAALLIIFVGIVITVCAAALSHLVRKAAELQDQSDLTI